MTDEALSLRSQVGLHTRYGRFEEARRARCALAVVLAEVELSELVATHSLSADDRNRLITVLAEGGGAR